MVKTAFKSIFQQTLAPVVLVAVLWVSMSSATTYYLHWIESSHRRFYVDNLVSIRAAEALRSLAWKLAAEWPDNAKSILDDQVRWRETESQIEEQRQKLKLSAFTEAERHVVNTLDLTVANLLHCLHRASNPEVFSNQTSSNPIDLDVGRSQILKITDRVAESTNLLLKINQELADRDMITRQKISRVVFAARVTMLIAGPLLGVLLGWRLSRLLHRSIARIAVTLRDAHSKSESDVGSIAIESSGDFQDIEQQAQKVAERMRQVSLDLQNARHEVLQSERLAAVGELAAGVAHEIRNPLTSVKLLLQHAARQTHGPRLDQSQIELILEETSRMEKTIQGLLDFSRPPRLNRVPHDLRQTLQRALNLTEARAHQQGIEIVTNVGDQSLMVDGDTEKLHQVLVNLLINAIEAMHDGGRLTIDAMTIEQGGASPLALTSKTSDQTPKQQFAQIVIRDTGPGIPKDVLPRLFEPFATSKERGTGLGLAVSHRIIEEHHGTILASNKAEGGAEFTLMIPAAATMANVN